MAAEQTPKRHAGALGLEIPERHVDRRERQHGRAAAAAVVHRPPHPLPEGFDQIAVLAHDDGRDLMGKRRCDRGPIVAGGVSVADAFAAVGIADPDGIELEIGHLAVLAVGQRLRQRYAIEAGARRG